jgi:hypothetical protein
MSLKINKQSTRKKLSSLISNKGSKILREITKKRKNWNEFMKRTFEEDNDDEKENLNRN